MQTLPIWKKQLVDSHIIPKSFYEEYGGKTLISISEKTNKFCKIRNGIYGKFLCNECEKKFSDLDNNAFNIIKKTNDTFSVKNELKQEIKIIENAFLSKEILHKFALSLLWRANNSNRQEYLSIELGSYDEKIRVALLGAKFSQQLLDATGVMIWEFRDSTIAEADAINYAYRRIASTKNSAFEQTFGRFSCHAFGFPYGEILIRLGGEKPKQGYCNMIEDRAFHLVLWSSSLCQDYPNLAVMKTPRTKNDGSVSGTQNLKPIFNYLKNLRETNNE